MLVPQILYEYLAIISPTPSVFADVMKMKGFCGKRYKWPSAIKSRPHITLSNFIQPLSCNQIVINTYRQLAAATSPFNIHLAGFGHFSTHTIYIKLTDKDKMCDLAKNIKLFTNARLKRIPNYPPHVMTEPHITIAKGISEDEFNRTWPMWRVKEYEAKFEATGILLFRKPYSDVRQNYEVVGDFPFTGSAILDPQLKMF